MDRAILEIIIRAKNQAKTAFDAANKDIDGGIKRLDDFGKKAMDVGKKMTMRLTLPIIAGAGFAVKAAKDLGESINAVNVVFEEGAASVLKFGESAATAAGLSRRAFNQAITPLGAMLRNMGFAAQAAGDEATKLTVRAADMASVFNTDVEEALTAISAGLRGEAEPLKRFGVSLLDSQIKAFALANGIIKTDREMTENEKTVARLGLLYQQTDRLQGDFVNTSGDLANATRIQQARLENMAAVLGEKLLPHALKIVETLGKWIDKFNELDPAQQDMIIKAALIVAALGPVVTILGGVIRGVVGILNVGGAFIGFLQTMAGTSISTAASVNGLSGAIGSLALVAGSAIVLTIGIGSIVAAIIQVQKLMGELKALELSQQQGIQTNSRLVADIHAGKVTKEREAQLLALMAKHAAELKRESQRPSFIQAFGQFFNLSKRQHGGPVEAGRPFLVGEAGPEVFIPRRSGQIVPNDQLAAPSKPPVTTNIYGDIILSTAPAVDRFFERQGRTQEFEDFGLSGGALAGTGR